RREVRFEALLVAVACSEFQLCAEDRPPRKAEALSRTLVVVPRARDRLEGVFEQARAHALPLGFLAAKEPGDHLRHVTLQPHDPRLQTVAAGFPLSCSPCHACAPRDSTSCTRLHKTSLWMGLDSRASQPLASARAASGPSRCPVSA